MRVTKPAGLRYIHRGDPAAYDFTQDTLTADSLWHTLSLASIIPANAKVVQFYVLFQAATVGWSVRVKKVGVTSNYNISWNFVQVANVNCSAEFSVDCTGQQISYYASNGTWTTIALFVKGWWV